MGVVPKLIHRRPDDYGISNGNPARTLPDWTPEGDMDRPPGLRAH
jgi:hypothetical protein